MNTIPPLSQAIRLGAMLRPQSFGIGMPVKSCALEAAAEAVGHNDFGMHAVRLVWPWTNQPSPKCPHEHRFLFFVLRCHWRPDSRIYERIYHLNDCHFWTRERTADWVAGIEPIEIEPRATIEPQSAGCAEEVRQWQEEVCR